ncbi:MAG: hypothetical protein ABI628_04540 [Chloroflexota bacterium]
MQIRSGRRGDHRKESDHRAQAELAAREERREDATDGQEDGDRDREDHAQLPLKPSLRVRVRGLVPKIGAARRPERRPADARTPGAIRASGVGSGVWVLVGRGG